MGCWCETDGVTQMPIRHGDKIRVFVLAHQGAPKGGGQCYSNEVWAPIGPPIQGTYDDYGGVEKIVKSPDNKLVLEKIKSNWVPFEDKYDKVPSISKMNLEEVLSFIERDNAKLKNYKGEEVPYGIMMVHEEVYQAMLSFNPIEAHHYWDDKGWAYMPQNDSLKIEVFDWYTRISKRFQSLVGVETRLTELIMDMSDSRLFADYRESAHKMYKKPLLDMITKGIPITDPEVQRMLTVCLEQLKFSRSMSAARKQWQPQSGKGSQQNETDIYRLLAKTTLAMADAWQKEDEKDGCSPVDAEGYTDYMREHNAEFLAESKNGKQKV